MNKETESTESAELASSDFPRTTQISLDAALPVIRHAEARCQREVFTLLMNLYHDPELIPEEWTTRLQRLILASRHLGCLEGLMTERTKLVTLNVETTLIDAWAEAMQAGKDSAMEAGRTEKQAVANG